jgi:hypothetical protein
MDTKLLRNYMKTKAMTEPKPTAIGVPYDEGYAEVKDPKTGADVGDLAPGSTELMPITIVAATEGITHEGDMGRLGKSE